MGVISWLKQKLDNGGHFHIGPRITVFWGNSAMHWTIQLYTKKYGYICKRFRSKGVEPYFYCSPNGTPWASTYYRGPDRNERVRSVIRKECFGHNFDPHGTIPDYGYVTDILFAINDYTGASKSYYINIKKVMESFDFRRYE